MNEVKRLWGRRFIGLVIVLLAFNYIRLASDRSDVEMIGAYADMVAIANDVFADCGSYEAAAGRAWQEYFSKRGIAADDEAVKAARDKLMQEARNTDGFKASVEEKMRTAKLYALSGTYRKDSFEYTNLLKTYYDLSMVADVTVRLGNGVWLEKLFEDDYVHIFALVLCIFTVYLFFTERKNGLYYIIHTAAGGRGRLYVKRCAILIAQSIWASLLFYVETAIILLNKYGGWEGVSETAVSSYKFLLTTGSLSRLEFFVVIVLLSALTVAVLAFLLWAVLLCFSNVNIGMFFYFFVCMMDVLLYKVISTKSVFRAFRFVNVYYLFFPHKAAEYYNWGYGTVVCSTFSTAVIISAFIGIMAVAVSSYMSIEKYFVNGRNVIERAVVFLEKYSRSFLEKLSISGKEAYKILISQRTIWVLLLLIYLVIKITPSVGVMYDAQKSYMFGYYEKAEGLGYGAELLAVYDGYEQEYERFVREFDYSAVNAEAVIENRRQLFEGIEANVNYIRAMNERGVAAVVINPYAYMDTIDYKEWDNQGMVAMLNVIAAIVIASGFISYEKQAKLHRLILTCRERRKWLIRKMAVQNILCVVFACLTYGIYYQKLCGIYDYRNLMAPLKSIMLFRDYFINPPIIGYILIDFLVKLIFLIVIQNLINVISIYVKYLYGFIAGLVILLPQLLYMAGFDYMQKFSIVKYISFFRCFIEGGKSMAIYYGVLLSAIMIGICAYVVVMDRALTNDA